MSTTTKTYDTTYKKKVEVDRDRYLPRQTPRGIIQCPGCGAFYFRRNWTLNPPSGFSNPVHSHPVYCPECMKIKDGYPSVELPILGVEPAERGENLLCDRYLLPIIGDCRENST